MTKTLKGIVYGAVGLLAMIGLGDLIQANEKDNLEKHFEDTINMVNGK